METTKIIKEKMLKDSEDFLNGLSIMEYTQEYSDRTEIINKDIT